MSHYIFKFENAAVEVMVEDPDDVGYALLGCLANLMEDLKNGDIQLSERVEDSDAE